MRLSLRRLGLNVRRALLAPAPTGVTGAQRWREALEQWAIPERIIAQAPQSPWIHPPALFDVPAVIADSPSHSRAREALGEEASVLDVGCGGGIAALALAPTVRDVTGVDHQPAMLEMFLANARSRGLVARTVEGFWPAVADEAPRADVVTCHHVVYNVPEITPFLLALDGHARNRTVIEMPTRHPLSSLNDAWRHFWGLERPDGPTPEDLLAVLSECGLDAHVEYFSAPLGRIVSPEQAVEFTRIRLCLEPSRDEELREFLTDHPGPAARSLATVWWDAR